jgi:hypothetical protein
MSKSSNIKIFLEELTYVASIPYNEAITTYSYYNNLSKELENEKCLNSSLKIELKQKENKIIYLCEELETEKCLNSSLKIELNTQNKIIKDLKSDVNDFNKCSICYENKLSICLNPCGHCYCDICIKDTDNCFICRTNIINKIKLFF